MECTSLFMFFNSLKRLDRFKVRVQNSYIFSFFVSFLHILNQQDCELNILYRQLTHMKKDFKTTEVVSMT